MGEQLEVAERQQIALMDDRGPLRLDTDADPRAAQVGRIQAIKETSDVRRMRTTRA